MYTYIYIYNTWRVPVRRISSHSNVLIHGVQEKPRRGARGTSG